MHLKIKKKRQQNHLLSFFLPLKQTFVQTAGCRNKLVVLLHCCEAIAAVNRAIAGGLEGNLCFFAAVSASGGEILSCLSGSVLLCVSAGLASLGFVLETFLGVEFLFTSGEYELVATILAYQCLVFVHLPYLLKFFNCPERTRTVTLFNLPIKMLSLSYSGIFA